MPLSYFRRPLAVLAAAHVLVLVLLRANGGLRESVPEPWRITGPARIEGRVLSGGGEGRLGRWLRLRAERQGLSADIMAYLPRELEESDIPLPGQRVALEGKLRRPRLPANPGDFDERAVVEARGCLLILHAGKLSMLEARVPLPWRPWAWAVLARRSLRRTFRGLYPPAAAAVLEGMLIGTKGPLDRELAEAIRNSGVAHLLVASGTNVGCLMAFSLWLAARAGLARARALALAAMACAFYALMAGGDPPVFRAYLCAFLAPASAALGRESGGFQAWLLSGLALLAAQPLALFSPGFQLSYAATLGLLIALPRWRLPVRWPPPLRLGAYALLASLAAQVAVFPILARVFGRVSVAGIVANAVWVPLSAVMLALGFAVWGLSALHVPLLLPGAAWLLGALASAFESSCRLCASLPAAALDVPPLSPAATAACILLALAALTTPEWRAARRAAAAALLAWAAGRGLDSSGSSTRLVFLSQPGRRALVASLPGGRHLLVDPDFPPARLSRALRALGVRRIERVLRRHPDVLQLGGLRLRRLPRGWALSGPGPEREYCILDSPHPPVPEACTPQRVFVPSRDGAVWAVYDGENLDVRARRGRAFRRRA